LTNVFTEQGRTRRRLSIAAAALVAVAASLVFGTTAATAEESESTRFEAIDLSSLEGPLKEFRPALARGADQLRVIFELSGDSVGEAMAQARANGKTLTQAQREAIRARLEAKQGTLVQRIRALDGKLLAEYQDAYNGVAAIVPAKALAALASTRGVLDVHATRIFQADNLSGVAYLEAPTAWTDTGRTGKGIKLGVIDSGIDYTHANFGGPATVAAYRSNDRRILEPGTFPTTKVAGGFDFVGDEYEAAPTDEEEFGNAQITQPRPDDDPLDCGGHGSHVAGSAGGQGVLQDGTTYRGPYTAAAFGSTNFLIAPGTAPDATLYAYKVFGCSGSTTEDVIVNALNRALADGMDVVNLSLGSPFGRTDEPSAVAMDVLALAGVVVVASAGNSGTSGFITGAPAAANRALSVAAIDASRATFPGATFALSTGQSFAAQNSNGAALPTGPLTIKVLRNANGTVSLGCNPAEYAGTAGMLVVTLRGTCARVARAVFADKAGAAAVAMIDTSAAYPPFEGEITNNPDTGEQYLVDIPFFGVRGVLGPSQFEDADLLVAADGGTVTLTPAEVANVGYQRSSSFTSGGPRNVDNSPKPDVIAPGTNVVSTDVGTGFKSARFSGTSMASPMTAGVAALVNEAHRDWSTERIKASIMNTAEAGTAKILAYDQRRAGAGVVNARRAVDTVGLALAGEGQSALAYGYEPLAGAYSETLGLALVNTGGTPITYNLAPAAVGSVLGTAFSINPSSVTVPAGGTVGVGVTLSLSAAAVAALPPATASNFGALVHNVRGAIVATPTSTGPGIYPLRVPFVLVPRGLSNVVPGTRSEYAATPTTLTATVPLTNAGIHSGNADVYAWGISDVGRDVGSGRERIGRGNRGVGQPEDNIDIRAAGVQVLPREALCGTAAVGTCGKAGDRSLIFAINVSGRWSSPSVTEYDIEIDLQNDGRPEFFVVGIDFGAAGTGTSDGRFASIVYNAAGRRVNAWVAEAPFNGSTMLLSTLASDIGVTEATPTFRYSITSFSLEYSVGEAELIDVTETATFRAFEPPVSSGDFIQLAPGQSAPLNLSVNRQRLPETDVYGWMIVTQDDPNGAPQADLIPLGALPTP